MRDRLVELLYRAHHNASCVMNEGGSEEEILEEEARYLLKYGVILPPCKVGVEVYFAAKERDRIFKGELISFSLDAAHFWFFCRYYCGLSLWHQVEDFGKTVFLTREEAERALKGDHQ